MSYLNKNNIILLNKKRGYSLLEVVIVVILLSIIVTSIITLLEYIINTASTTTVNNDGYINGKLSIEFLTSEIERTSNIDIYLYEDNYLEKMILYKDSDKIYKEANVIYFYRESGIRNNSIYFGGVSNNNITYTNKFSSYINSVKIIKVNNFIDLHINTLETIDGKEAKSYEFISKINIKNKNIIFFEKKYWHL